jgi:uridine phosphorylase
MSKIKFYNSLKNLSVEIENIKNENVGVWLEENIVHIQNNNELLLKLKDINGWKHFTDESIINNRLSYDIVYATKLFEEYDNKKYNFLFNIICH